MMSARLRRERLVQQDKRYVWHPYTEMGSYIESTDPLVIDRAVGAELFDVDGRSYLDANASWWTAALGHNHPRLLAALRRQCDQLSHVALAGITHEAAVDCAASLVQVAPSGLSRVLFSDNGSTAVECALRLALQFFSQNHEPERTRLLCLEGAFHGDTLGAAEVSGVEEFNQLQHPSREVCRLPSPADDLERALSALEAELSTAGHRTAALVLEPVVQAAAGMRIYSPEYLRVARRLTEAAGVLLIADEVFTGFGRTGPMWAVNHAAVRPDILCIAKGLSGGLLPFAAVLATERIFQGFIGDPRRAFYYGHTYSGNPLGAAVALETLRVYDEEQVLERARHSARLLEQAASRLSELPHVRDVRCLGMVLAMDLDGAKGYLERSGWRVYHEALLRGVYLRPLGNVVYVTPALNIPTQQLERLLDVMFESVRVAGNRNEDSG